MRRSYRAILPCYINYGSSPDQRFRKEPCVTNTPDAAHALSARQRFFAYLAILAFGMPSVLIALTGGEMWPFLDYRMYAEAKFTPDVDWLALVGRTDNGAPFPLDDERYIAPFAPSELLRALYTLDVLNATDKAQRALQGLIATYDRNRLAGEHNGPHLVSLEVYRLRWHSRSGTPYQVHALPDIQEFLYAVSLP